MKALIFGANGQDGHYLSEACRKRQIEVIGVSRGGPWLHGDVASQELVEGLVRNHHPEIIFHLAASSTTRHEALYEHHTTLGKGTLNILEAVKRWSPASKVFLAGSGLQFLNHERPISETDLFGHSSGYVAARNYSVYLARYFRNLGLKVYIGYLFHHESPFRGMNHVSQKIIRAVRSITEGAEARLELGDASVKKEWTFAGDIVEGIMTLVEQDRVFEVTIGSGVAYPIHRWLDECFGLIGKDWKEYVIEKKDFKAEYQLLVSNPSTVNGLGWEASTTIGELAKLMLAHRALPEEETQSGKLSGTP